MCEYRTKHLPVITYDHIIIFMYARRVKFKQIHTYTTMPVIRRWIKILIFDESIIFLHSFSIAYMPCSIQSGALASAL